ncbi:BlaI/MecI/CopY family transcriptional regulator [Thalassotalea marina]|nr:BlaI/MecI/CopY family transcriptional regulator [Thalassotalea marina]
MAEISPTEFEILDAMWREYPVTANDLVERLNKDKPWHDKTVKTLINRLVKKQAISFEKQGRTYLYFPLVSREDYRQKASKSFIERIFSGRLSPLVAGFAKNNTLQAEDIEQLKSIIDDWEKEQSGNKGQDA